jgi:DNA-directed RNA polymerase subunit RPC12/RpoP
MKELNLETLVWTRGRKMLLSDLKDRMMCPQCGGRRISKRRRLRRLIVVRE